MNQYMVAVIQNLIFSIIDFLILCKVWKNRKKSECQKIFCVFTFNILCLELFTILEMLVRNNTIFLGLTGTYIFYNLEKILTGFVGYLWFQIFLNVFDSESTVGKDFRIVLLLPFFIYLILNFTSCLTHLIYYLVINEGKIVFCTGKHIYLEGIIYIYFFISLGIIIFSSITNKRKIGRDIRYLLLLSLPCFIGYLIQGIWNFNIGLTHTCASVSVICVYLELIVDEANESEKLRFLVDINKDLQKSKDEKESQLEEIKALNLNLEKNEIQLKEYASEKKSQFEEISALNQVIQKSRDRLSDVLGMIQGLSQEYHTIWLVNRENFRMSLVRTSNKASVREVVEIGKETGDYWETCEYYINTFVLEQDRARLFVELSPEKIASHIDNSKEVYNVKYLRKATDGTVSYHQMSFVNADTEAGKRQFVLGFRDIDEVVNAEAQTKKELADRLSIIQTLSKVYFASFYVDIKENSFIELSNIEEVREKIGVRGNAQESLFMVGNQMVSPEFSEDLNKFVDLSTIDERLKDKDVITFEYIGNTTGWSQIYIIAGDRNPLDGKIKNILVATRKIHEEKKREEELMHREKMQLKTISEAIHGGFKISKIDRDYTFKYVSNQLAEMLGYTIEEFMEVSGGKMSAMVDINSESEELKKAEVTAQDGKMYTMTYRMRCKDGTWKNVEDRGRVIQNVNGEKESWCFIMDKDEITEKTKALELAEVANKALIESQIALENARQAAEAANSAKTSFLFNMSHDIRTPMNAIIGFTKLLEKHQEEPEKRAGYLQKIEDSSSVLLSILNNVLEMARIEKGAVEVDETAWSVEQFNDTLYSVFTELMKQKEIEYTKEIDIQHNYVYCDAIKLREVFLNIISNAYKYTESGGKIKMQLKEIPSNKEGYVLFQTTISDTGIGMSPEFIPHIFEEFSREKNTTDNKIEGTGLGMPIVKRLLDIMDGTIEVHSEKGKGSTFIVTVPHKIAEKVNMIERAGIEIDPKLFAGKRILLAEDNELNSEIAVSILEEVGFKVDCAVDGVNCLEILNNSPDNFYDIILMDVQMPNMNGYEATRSIRALNNPSKASIPILAMTANAFEEDKREAMRSGMNGHVSKPIDVHELLQEISKFMG